MSRINEAVVSNAPTDSFESDALYQVRLIHDWPPTLHVTSSSLLDQSIVSSFYGLQLELRGTAKSETPTTLINYDQIVSGATEKRKIVALPLQFGSKSPASAALLDAIAGPFQVVVTGKIPPDPSIDEDLRAILQQMNSVQVNNTLLAINGEKFLTGRHGTGIDVYRQLWSVASRASLATPYELTLVRHNLIQASSKIVPFAKRKDVQDAQLAQLPKLAAQETALSLEIRCKKLFLMQQLDFEREHYLAAYLSDPLQALHTKVMGDGQWQAYEFDKTLWYFHAPTGRLYAQHPLRSHPEARELIKRVQEQVQEAVRRLQRRIRTCQRRQRFKSVLNTKMQRNEVNKLKEQQIQQAVRRIQCKMRSYQRRKRFLATLELEKKRKEEEQQQAEIHRRERQRVDEIRQMEEMQQERRSLQQELDEMKLKLQELKATRVSVQSETQTSGRRDDERVSELLRKEEQQQVQERLAKLELDVQSRKQTSAVESQTQTSSRRDAEQQRIEELKLSRSSKVTLESLTQTSSPGFCDEGVDTGDDLEWQRYLTLLRVAVKHKKTKVSSKTRYTQTESIDGETTFLLQAPQNAVSLSSISRKSTGEWDGFPSWHQCSDYSSSNNSSTSNLLTLKSSVKQFEELNTMSPPPRTFESFFSPERMGYEQPPPPLVDHPWRQKSTFLPVKSSRMLVEITPQHQPLRLQMQEYQEPIRPIHPTANSSPTVHDSPVSSPAKLPYITRRRKKLAGSSP